MPLLLEVIGSRTGEAEPEETVRPCSPLQPPPLPHGSLNPIRNQRANVEVEEHVRTADDFGSRPVINTQEMVCPAEEGRGLGIFSLYSDVYRGLWDTGVFLKGMDVRSAYLLCGWVGGAAAR